MARVLLGDSGDWTEFDDPGMGRFRAARLERGRLEGCLFIGPDTSLPPRSWLGGLFGDGSLGERERIALLTGRPPAGEEEAGRTVCACFGVGLNTLATAIREQGLTSVEAVGAVLKAGTGCGSCVAEIKGLLVGTRETVT